jgi:RNA polymerase sigma-70 factor (ECF subfamily)
MALDSPGEERDIDEELLRAVRAAPEGDLRAFEQLVIRYQNRVLANCRYLTRDGNNAEDLSQEVFLKAYFGLPKFEGRSTFRHWLNRIKVNHCLNHLKKNDAGRKALALDDDSANAFDELRAAPEAAERLERMEEGAKIDGILESMPATLRVPLIMRDMDDLSYEEIADALGLGLSAVKMRIKRGRELFRRLYPEMGA